MILEQEGGTSKPEELGYKSKGPPFGGPVFCFLTGAQLFSLLARFQLISSPIVELVLETGCL
jgi:hypothetical protein